jgi:hypothetical protein
MSKPYNSYRWHSFSYILIVFRGSGHGYQHSKAPTTQQAPTVTIASVILLASDIPMALAIPLDSTISAGSSTILVGLAILVHLAISEASVVPSPKSPTAPIPTPIHRQTMVSQTWIEDPLRYRAAMTQSSCVPSETLITPDVEPIFLHVS